MPRIRTLAGIILIGVAVGMAWLTIPRQTGSVLEELPPTTPVGTVAQVPAALVPSTAPSPGTVDPILEARSGSVAVEVPPASPSRIRIPKLGVDAAVIALGVDADGRMDVPRDVDEVGWYRFGPRPGEAGSAVLAAHIDSAGQGPGVFFRIGVLGQGDLIELEDEQGEPSLYVVRAVDVIPKDELPLERVFARSGSPVLTLITCGGSFSRSERSYESNVVVVAVPVQEAPDEGADPR